MTFPDSDQRLPDAYTQHAFANGVHFSTYTPNDEERSARAAKDKAEANKTQAQADEIDEGRSWKKWQLRSMYGLYTLGMILFGFVTGFLAGRFL